jgi:glycosyltransferase involved in cell wall biosynthesis
MIERPLRVLVVLSHVVQYAVPGFRQLALDERIEFHVAYCNLRGAEPGLDPEFGAVVRWDVPLLDGYSWTHIPNRGSGAERFFGLFNPGLWKFIRQGKYDAVICYTGYLRASFWISYLAAKSSGARFLFGNDSITLFPRDGRSWKATVKKNLWPRLFRLSDQVLVPSSASRDLMLTLGLKPEHITLVPIVIDNEWWIRQSSLIHRDVVRSFWGATPEDSVVLFCAKLQPWKRPMDLLRAFAQARLPNTLLVFAGDGPMRNELETEAKNLSIDSRVRFLGFVNQSQLPAVYTSADVMVLPSEFEPFAVVVNEAMCCGCPVIASHAVGSARDLIAPVQPGFVYPSGDVSQLAAILKRQLPGRAALNELGAAFRMRMRSWSLTQHVAALMEAVQTAVARNKSTLLADNRHTARQPDPPASQKSRE